jgi:prepilin-type N-terminal cleavage/methylation domain-containing protein
MHIDGEVVPIAGRTRAVGHRRRAIGCRRGMTLIEVMVVVSIIALLLALLVPAVGGARESARRTQCGNNVKQLVIGLHRHVSSFGTFPAGNSLRGATTSAATNWCQQGSVFRGMPWTVAVLPFIEQDNLFDRFDPRLEFMTDTFSLPANQNGQNALPIATLQCPSSLFGENPLRNNYFGVQGSSPVSCTDGSTPNGTRRFYINGLMYVNSQVGFGHVRDGTSNVFALGETNMCGLSLNTASGRIEHFNWVIGGKAGSSTPMPLQLAGVELPINSWRFQPSSSIMLQQGTRGFGSDHPGGCFFALADGSVQFISELADLNVLTLLGGRRDGGIFQDGLQ